jgi:hypothetical protein
VLPGRDDAAWSGAGSAVPVWGVETRSGFTVAAADGGELHVRAGAEYSLVAQRWYRLRYRRALRSR